MAINAVEISNYTPLLYAVEKNYSDIVKLMIEEGTDINAVEIYNTAPLPVVVRENNLDIVNNLTGVSYHCG